LGDQLKEGEMRGKWDGRKYTHILGTKLEGKRPHTRPKCRRKNNIKMDIGEIRCANVEWIYLEDRDQYQVLKKHLTY
jgi:hypothetical protein